MLNYVNRFIPNFSSLTEALHELIRKDIMFHWDEKQELAFQSSKKCLLTAPFSQLF